MYVFLMCFYVNEFYVIKFCCCFLYSFCCRAPFLIFIFLYVCVFACNYICVFLCCDWLICKITNIVVVLFAVFIFLFSFRLLSPVLCSNAVFIYALVTIPFIFLLEYLNVY